LILGRNKKTQTLAYIALAYGAENVERVEHKNNTI
jgi:hypothetical protein